ncbi:MAG: hypothetical protein ACLQU5_19960 [Isosphaeraceae bacterium]
MFFNESEHLATKNPQLKGLIEKIDEKIAEFDSSALARVADFSRFFRESINRITGIFEGYVTEGVLERVEMVDCINCQTLTLAIEYRAYLSDQKPFPCSCCGEDLTAQAPRQCYAYKLTPNASSRTARFRVHSPTPINHVVLLIHGIRTTAEWQEMVAQELNAIPGVKAIPIGYEYLDVVKFWFPVWTRRGAVRKILAKIRHARALYPKVEFSAIAHSFGTYSIFRILHEEADIKFKRIILCGSIVSHDTPWAYLQPRVEEEILNDCGTRDIWPVAARAFSWGYGATGTFGFKSPGIHDRFHDTDHGGFFNEQFIQRFWVPFIAKGEIVPSTWTSKRPCSPGWLSFCSSALFRWMLCAALTGIVWVVWRWFQ